MVESWRDRLYIKPNLSLTDHAVTLVAIALLIWACCGAFSELSGSAIPTSVPETTSEASPVTKSPVEIQTGPSLDARDKTRRRNIDDR